MTSTDAQKRLAVDVHSRQAGEFADAYEALSADPYGSCFAYSRMRLLSALERYLPPAASGAQALDLGCGTGHYIRWLESHGFTVAGVDGSEAMLSRARQASPDAELHRSDVESLPFSDSRFDLILCVEVLRYLPDPEPCLREAARVLKPGGVALITALPLLNLNGYYLVNRLAHRRALADLVGLKQFFTTSTRLRRSFRAAGFPWIEVHGVYLGPINWIERLARPLLPRFLKAWRRVDEFMADRLPMREMANMFLVVARKPGPS